MELKNKKILPIILMLVGILNITLGVSIAFFNYTRTGSANTIKVGRISFVTRQTKNISLTNLFPIDPTDTAVMSDPTKVGTLEIEIEGDTDYSKGVEYLVSSENTHITTSSGNVVPISLDVIVTNLGTENPNYFIARESKDTTIYKKLVGGTLVGDQMLLVGFIKPNTTQGTIEGINGKLTIKAYLDENKILISDTYDGTESDNMGTPNSLAEGKTVLTTEEWNSLSTGGVSFQIKVEANEGIWVNGSLEEIMKKGAVIDNTASDYVSASTGIDFSEVSSDTNGKGVYMRAGTENDTCPILYYRGDVTDNNVIFADKCWKAVRTTDTCGVKLIYNGEKNTYQYIDSEFKDYNMENSYVFDSSDNTWNAVITSNNKSDFKFKVRENGDYTVVITGTTSLEVGGNVILSKDNVSINGSGGGNGNNISLSHTISGLTTNNEINISYDGTASTSSPITLKIKVLRGNAVLNENDYNLIYSGAPHDITFDSDNLWNLNIQKNAADTIIFSPKTAGRYKLYFETNNRDTSVLLNDNIMINEESLSYDDVLLGDLETNDIIKVIFSSESVDGKIKFKLERRSEPGCFGIGDDAGISINNVNKFKYNELETTFSAVGYMYGNKYNVINGITPVPDINTIWGSDFIYENGVYKLINTKAGRDENHRYTCNSSNADDVCSKLYLRLTSFYYELENGYGYHDMINNMTQNINDSVVKDKIDTWYESSMMPYREQLEDTIWCNDRSIYSKGWFDIDASYSYEHSELYFSSRQRLMEHTPLLSCSSKNDSFTVNNSKGNMNLKYPIALLTSDELMLAGGIFPFTSENTYLNSSSYFWTMSPNLYNFNGRASTVFGQIGSQFSNNSFLIRPSISLKPGTPVISGDGTATSPYVIEN